jgi:hypothetical protein
VLIARLQVKTRYWLDGIQMYTRRVNEIIMSHV